MWPGLSKLVYRLQCLVACEDGQDLVEYTLVIAMIATGATAGMKGLANLVLTVLTNINTEFTNLI